MIAQKWFYVCALQLDVANIVSEVIYNAVLIPSINAPRTNINTNFSSLITHYMCLETYSRVRDSHGVCDQSLHQLKFEECLPRRNSSKVNCNMVLISVIFEFTISWVKPNTENGR